MKNFSTNWFSLEKIFIIRTFAVIEKVNNQLVQGQVNMAVAIEQTNRVPFFSFIIFTVCTLLMSRGRRIFCYWQGWFFDQIFMNVFQLPDGINTHLMFRCVLRTPNEQYDDDPTIRTLPFSHRSQLLGSVVILVNPSSFALDIVVYNQIFHHLFWYIYGMVHLDDAFVIFPKTEITCDSA